MRLGLFGFVFGFVLSVSACFVAVVGGGEEDPLDAQVRRLEERVERDRAVAMDASRHAATVAHLQRQVARHRSADAPINLDPTVLVHSIQREVPDAWVTYRVGARWPVLEIHGRGGRRTAIAALDELSRLRPGLVLERFDVGHDRWMIHLAVRARVERDPSPRRDPMGSIHQPERCLWWCRAARRHALALQTEIRALESRTGGDARRLDVLREQLAADEGERDRLEHAAPLLHEFFAGDAPTFETGFARSTTGDLLISGALVKEGSASAVDTRRDPFVAELE